jgi:hypothetical protein
MKADGRTRALDAATRLSRATDVLRFEAEHAPNDSARWLARYEAGMLLWKVLLDARTLVDLFPIDEEAASEEAELAARTLYRALKARRQAALLAQTEGRTAEEAKAFRAKATELGAA